MSPRVENSERRRGLAGLRGFCFRFGPKPVAQSRDRLDCRAVYLESDRRVVVAVCVMGRLIFRVDHGDKYRLPGVVRPARSNAGTAALLETALLNGEGSLSGTGAPFVTTGKVTGRSSKDKHIVSEPSMQAEIWWKGNRAMSRPKCDILKADMRAYQENRDVRVQDLICGSDPAHPVNTRLISNSTWQALFLEARALFLLRAAIGGALGLVQFKIDRVWGVQIPCDGPAEARSCLDPNGTWQDKLAFEQATDELRSRIEPKLSRIGLSFPLPKGSQGQCTDVSEVERAQG